MNLADKYAKQLAALRLMDDDFMSAVFDNNIEATQLVLDILLTGREIKVKSVTSQKEYRSLGGRSVRLDVFAEDENGIPVDIEIQRADKGASSQRARFNSSMLDSKLLQSGEDFSALRESYVIFITEHDVLKHGLPIYHIERKIEETNESFHDGAHIIYVNGKYEGNDEIGRLMHDFRCNVPDEMIFEPLANKVRYYKEEIGGQNSMCRIWEDIKAEGLAEGLAKGQTRARLDNAKKLLNAGVMSREEIIRILDLTDEEAELLKKDDL